MAKTHLLGLSEEELSAFVQSLGEPAFRARQLRNWIFQHLETDFTRMRNLPKSLVEKLNASATVMTLSPEAEQHSSDGTVKWALKAADGRVFECVMIPSEDRRSVCVSSQVGCAMGCTFCRTATMGFIRQLTLGEILEQVFFVSRFLREREKGRVSNVIFMGMGEPLLNLDAVAQACRILSHPDAFGIGKHRITVSTSGIAPKILEWGEKAPEFKLAISLNGSNNEIRSSLMPVNRRYPLETLLDTADRYIRLTGQKLTFEYILIRGRTCTVEAARELKRIASHRNCKINLIPLNKGEDPDLQAPAEEEIERFERELGTGDFQVLRRRSRGPDIFAACGQLAQKTEKTGRAKPQSWTPAAGETVYETTSEGK